MPLFQKWDLIEDEFLGLGIGGFCRAKIRGVKSEVV